MITPHKNRPQTPSPKDLPKEITLEVTQKCNLDCRACFSEKKPIEIPLVKVKKTIDDCRRLGIKFIRITGGEPLLYSHIKEALHYAKRNNLPVILNTNATILDKKNRRLIKNSVDNLLVSLRGFDPASERKLTRSKIDFKEKISNIAELNLLVPALRIGTVISRTLIDNFPKYHSLIKKLKIKRWELYRPLTDSKDEEYRVNRSGLLKIMRYIMAARRSGEDIQISNPVPFCITKDLGLSNCVLFGGAGDDGHKRIILDAEGFFKPSYSINKNLGREIEAAWLNPFLKKMRSLSYLPKKCKKCFYLNRCKGGSRYWAKIINHDYFACVPLMKNK